MKLFFHHFLKDLRHQRWLLAFWLLILLARVVLLNLAAQPDNQLSTTAEDINSSGLFFLLTCLTWTLIIVRLIQSEPITGQSSFWLTRPIPPAVSVSSKTFFILALLVLPALVPMMTDFVLFRVTPAHFAYESVYTLLGLELIVALGVVWLATYTRTLLLFWGVTGVLALLFFPLAIFMSLPATHRLSQDSPLNASLMTSRTFLFVLCLIISLIGSLIVQNWFRRTRKAFLLGVAGLLLSLVCLFWWPIALPPIPGVAFSLFHPAFTKTVSLDYKIDPSQPLSWSRGNFNDQPMNMASMGFLAPSTGPSVTPSIQFVAASFQPTDGAAVPLRGKGLSITYLSPLPRFDWTSQLQHDNPDLTIIGQNPVQGDRCEIFRVTPERALQLKDQTGTLSLNINGELLSLKKSAEMPLNGTKFVRIPNTIVRLISTQMEKNTFTLTFTEVGYKELIQPVSLVVYLLVDPRTHQATLLKNYGGRSTSSSRLFIGGLVKESARTTLTANADLAQLLGPDRANDSTNDLVLYIYTVVPTDRFESTITVPDFKFPTPP